MVKRRIECGSTRAFFDGLGIPLILENGEVINDGFLDYKIPSIGDIPEIETILIESNDPHGPFGAKGIGEYGLVPTAPAISNAIYNACGIRVHELPISRELILEELRKIGE